MFQTDPFSLIVLLVGLSLLPFLAMIATSYLKILVVISLIRNALGIQSIPPNMVVNALALILTFYIMAPILGESWDICSKRLAENKVAAQSAERTEAPKGGLIAAANGTGVVAMGGPELESRTKVITTDKDRRQLRHNEFVHLLDNACKLIQKHQSVIMGGVPTPSPLSEAFQDSPLYTPEEETDQRTYTPTFQNNASGNVLFALPGIN